MTHHDDRERLAAAASDATLAVPGVACLRPGLTQLLRTAALSAAGRPQRADTGGRTASGVRVSRQSGPDGWTIDVHLVLNRGHRAVDVTRAVRAAVERAVLPGVGDVPVRIGVTVSGVV